MAKENEKKVSGELNEEELENVAGGACLFSGASVPNEVKSMEKEKPDKDGNYSIIITYQNGERSKIFCKPDGKAYGCNFDRG